jgi:hypothetical protein
MMELKKLNIYVRRSEMDKIINKCEVCCRKDKKYYKSTFHIQTSRVGERVGIDIMEIGDNDLVLLAIDYFSRKIFGKAITTKHTSKILEFVNEVNKVFKIEMLV